MGEFSHYALQVAVYNVLAANTVLMNSVSGVFDHVPPKTAYPYMTIGDTRATDISTMDIALTQMELVLHVYSRERGRKEISDIMRQLHDLLHDSNPVMEDHVAVSLRYTGSDITQEGDGLTYHGRMRFGAVLQHV